jgi:hypothetical protein
MHMYHQMGPWAHGQAEHPRRRCWLHSRIQNQGLVESMPLNVSLSTHFFFLRRLKKLLKLATQPRSLPMQTYVELEDWVHDSGRMVLIGEAAHPLPVRQARFRTTRMLTSLHRSERFRQQLYHWKMAAFLQNSFPTSDQKIKFQASFTHFRIFEVHAARL